MLRANEVSVYDVVGRVSNLDFGDQRGARVSYSLLGNRGCIGRCLLVFLCTAYFKINDNRLLLSWSQDGVIIKLIL